MANVDSMGNTASTSLQLFASRYGYAALLDNEGNEQRITENMILAACEEALDSLYSYLPPKRLATKTSDGSVKSRNPEQNLD